MPPRWHAPDLVRTGSAAYRFRRTRRHHALGRAGRSRALLTRSHRVVLRIPQCEYITASCLDTTSPSLLCPAAAYRRSRGQIAMSKSLACRCERARTACPRRRAWVDEDDTILPCGERLLTLRFWPSLRTFRVSAIRERHGRHWNRLNVYTEPAVPVCGLLARARTALL